MLATLRPTTHCFNVEGDQWDIDWSGLPSVLPEHGVVHCAMAFRFDVDHHQIKTKTVKCAVLSCDHRSVEEALLAGLVVDAAIMWSLMRRAEGSDPVVAFVWSEA